MELHAALQLIREGYTLDGVDYRQLNESVVASIAGLTVVGGILFGMIAGAAKLDKMTDDRIAANPKHPMHKEVVARRKAIEDYKNRKAGNSSNSKVSDAEIEAFKKNNSAEKIHAEMRTDLKKMVAEAKKNTEIQAKCKQTLAKKDLENGKFSITYNDEGDFIEIIKGDQEVKSALHWLIKDFEAALKAKYADAIKYKVVELSSGDGDEGCLYIE
jgi:hypothetical protein